MNEMEKPSRMVANNAISLKYAYLDCLVPASEHAGESKCERCLFNLPAKCSFRT